jgi:hypothetical protein
MGRKNTDITKIAAKNERKKKISATYGIASPQTNLARTDGANALA